MSISDSIVGVLQNITRNREQVQKQLDAASQAVGQLDDVSLASIKQLLTKWEHPQAVNQFIASVAQQDGLTRAAAEMDAAIAVMQAASADPAFIQQVEAQAVANAAAANSPLPDAGQSSGAAPAAGSAPAAPTADSSATG